MVKKNFHYIFLIASALLYWYIKTNQRGPQHQNNYPTNNNTTVNEKDLNRHPGNIIYSRHCQCRMECRHITETEIKEILENGQINSNKIEHSAKGVTYPLEGVTNEKQHLRVVFAPKGDEVEVVTCIDLDNEWPCNCEVGNTGKYD